MVDPADVETVVSVDHDGETVTVPAQFDSSDNTVNTGLPGEWWIDRVYTNGEGKLVAEKYIPGGQFIRAVWAPGPSSENVWEAYYWEPQTRTSARTFRAGDDETDHWVRNGSVYADHRQHESIGRVISDTTAARGVDWYVCRVAGRPQIEWAEATSRNRTSVAKNIRRAREDIFGDDSDVDVEQYVRQNDLWTESEIIDDLAEVIAGTTVAGGIDEYAKLMDVPDVDWAETTDRNRHTIKDNRERAFDDRFE